MRVLFLTHRLPYAPNRGDRARAYYALKTLAAAGMQVDLLSLVHDGEERSRASTLLSLASNVMTASVPRLANLRRSVLALPTNTPLTHVLLDSPDLKPAIARLMLERRPDVVLAYCSGMARLAVAPPLQETPFVLDMVDVDSAKWSTLGATAPLPRRWVYRREARCLARFEASAVDRAQVTLVINERERVALARLAPQARIEVLPAGIDIGGLRPLDPPSEEARVVFCGVMNYEPNVDAAVWLADAVWPLVRRVRPDARLVLLGASPSRRVRALARRDPTVEVTGTVSDVRAQLWRSAVAAAPLRLARGVQTKVLEAVAAGLPAVVTPVVAAGLPPAIGDACLVADTASDFAAALLGLLRQRGVERRQRAARADVDRLAWERQFAPLPGIVESAVCRGTHAVGGYR